MVTITNPFHGTSARARIGRKSERQTRRILGTLCPSRLSGCRCSCSPASASAGSGDYVHVTFEAITIISLARS